MKITSDKAVAFMFVDGQPHQVEIPASVLTGLLDAWFKHKGHKGILVNEEPFGAFELGEPESLPTSK